MPTFLALFHLKGEQVRHQAAGDEEIGLKSKQVESLSWQDKVLLGKGKAETWKSLEVYFPPIFDLAKSEMT